MPRLIKIAFACGAVPFIAGSAIYFTWRLTRWESLELFGLVNIFCGLALFVVGTGCLIFQMDRERRSDSSEKRGTLLRNTLVAGLLLVNFPAAATYGLSALDVMSRITVRIVNDSGDRIDSVKIQGIGFKEEFGPMPAGGHTRLYIRRFGEGSAEFTALQRGRVMEGELCGYVMGGEDITLRFLPSREFIVANNRDVEYLTRD